MDEKNCAIQAGDIGGSKRCNMEKQILSDKEIESIIQFKRNRKSGIRIVDLYHALNEEFAEYEKKRALLEERACLTTGDIKYNPVYLRCPKCGCKYVVFYQFFSYLRKTTDCTPAKGQHLSAASDEFGAEYNYCLGCGHRFNDHGNGM